MPSVLKSDLQVYLGSDQPMMSLRTTHCSGDLRFHVDPVCASVWIWGASMMLCRSLRRAVSRDS